MYLTNLAFLFITLLLTPTLQLSLPETVYQFPNTTWVENIRATRNGSLLVTLIGKPEVHIIDPSVRPASSALIYSFPHANSVLGITELVQDQFAVAVGNYSTTTGTTPGSYSIWNIDLSRSTLNHTVQHVSKIADVPGAQMLNGITTLNPSTLLLADSVLGKVFKLNTRNGISEIVLDHPSMKPVAGSAVKIGLNGVRVMNGWLYYTNIFQNSVWRVAVDPATGKASSAYELVANVTTPDDLDVVDDGSVIVAQSRANVVSRVEPSGAEAVLAGNLNSSTVAGATGAVLGRSWRDRGVVYASTTGGIGAPVNGTFLEGGKIVALDVAKGWVW